MPMKQREIDYNESSPYSLPGFGAYPPFLGGPTAHMPISGRVRPPRARMLPLRRHNNYDK